MKRFARVSLYGGLIALALLLGILLGERGGLSGLLTQLREWRTGKNSTKLDPNDPALKAGLPVPDPAAGLAPCPLNNLLKPGLTPQEQTGIIGQMLLDYHSSVHALPNGTWEEVVAQLSGANKAKLALVPKDHPALSKDAFRASVDSPGIRLHVISSTGGAFQLIYDGPDKLPYTEDDLVRNYPPDLEFGGPPKKPQ